MIFHKKEVIVLGETDDGKKVSIPTEENLLVCADRGFGKTTLAKNIVSQVEHPIVIGRHKDFGENAAETEEEILDVVRSLCDEIEKRAKYKTFKEYKKAHRNAQRIGIIIDEIPGENLLKMCVRMALKRGVGMSVYIFTSSANAMNKEFITDQVVTSFVQTRIASYTMSKEASMIEVGSDAAARLPIKPGLFTDGENTFHTFREVKA